MRRLLKVIRWLPIIWRDRDWDWYYLAKMMEFKFRNMAKCFDNGHHTRSHIDARQCRVCAELLRRLLADDYWDNAKGMPNRAAHSMKMHTQDQRYLGILIGKYFTHWWD